MVTPTADTIATVQLRQEGSDRATEKRTGARTLAIAISPWVPGGTRDVFTAARGLRRDTSGRLTP